MRKGGKMVIIGGIIGLVFLVKFLGWMFGRIKRRTIGRF